MTEGLKNLEAKENSPRVKIIDTTGKIKPLKEAKKFCQDHARICYSEKDIEDIQKEPYSPFLVDNILIKNGHHSPFDMFHIDYYFDGFPKTFAMTLNNQNVYSTCEKSARYTEMRNQDPKQKKLYDKWKEIFLERISEEYPREEHERLYSQKQDKNSGVLLPSTAEKLSQENARYLTSVFTPTKFAHTLSLRQMNIVANYFEDFISENKNTDDIFKQRLINSYKNFLEQDEVKSWRIPGIKRKAQGKLNFFGEPNQEFFGKDVYSTNVTGSFAYLAQSQRHKTEYHHISDGWQLGAPLGFFVPPIIRETSLEKEWMNDLENVASYDFPQAQMLSIAQSGQASNFYEKTRERVCGCAQLEITLLTADLVKRYSSVFPQRSSWGEPECYSNPCRKGGCPLGPENYLTRKI